MRVPSRSSRDGAFCVWNRENVNCVNYIKEKQIVLMFRQHCTGSLLGFFMLSNVYYDVARVCDVSRRSLNRYARSTECSKSERFFNSLSKILIQIDVILCAAGATPVNNKPVCLP